MHHTVKFSSCPVDVNAPADDGEQTNPGDHDTRHAETFASQFHAPLTRLSPVTTVARMPPRQPLRLLRSPRGNMHQLPLNPCIRDNEEWDSVEPDRKPVLGFELRPEIDTDLSLRPDRMKLDPLPELECKRPPASVWDKAGAPEPDAT